MATLPVSANALCYYMIEDGKVELDAGEDARLSAIEAEGWDMVLVNTVVRPGPRLLDPDELTPELRLIADETAERRRQDHSQGRGTGPTQPAESPGGWRV